MTKKIQNGRRPKKIKMEDDKKNQNGRRQKIQNGRRPKNKELKTTKENQNGR